MSTEDSQTLGKPTILVRSNKEALAYATTQYLSPDDNCPILRCACDGGPYKAQIWCPRHVSHPVSVLGKRGEAIHFPAVIDELPHLHCIVTPTRDQLVNRSRIGSNERTQSTRRRPGHRCYSHRMSLLNLHLLPRPVRFVSENRNRAI